MVPHEYLQAAWNRIGDRLERVIEKTHSVAEVKNRLGTGEYRLWLFHEGNDVLLGMVTEIAGDVLWLHAAAGRRLRDCLSAMSVLGDYGIANQCRVVRSRARPGFAHMGQAKYGFREVARDESSVTVELELSGFPRAAEKVR